MTPYGKHHIDEEDADYVKELLLSGQFLAQGYQTPEFESRLAKKVGAEHVVVCTSGTSALHLVMLAMNLEPENKVIVPSTTFVATANAVMLAGGQVVFADVHPTTGLMTEETMMMAVSEAGEDLIAIVGVDMNGNPIDRRLQSIAQDLNVPFIIDGAHSLGGMYELGDATYPVGYGKHVDATIFSFHPVKAIACGEGGAIATDDPVMAARMRHWRSHGIMKKDSALGYAPWEYEQTGLGFNYRMSDINATLGLAQLERLDQTIYGRRQVAKRYDAAFEDIMWSVVPVPQSPLSAFHLYPILLRYPELKRGLVDWLEEKGIGSQVHYIPVHTQPYYARQKLWNLPGAEKYYERALSIPMFPMMDPREQDWVIKTIKEFMKESGA